MDRSEDIPLHEPSQAERLLHVILRSNVTVWHARPGVDQGGYWHPTVFKPGQSWTAVPAGLFLPTAKALYGTLLRIHQLDPALSVRLACFALLQMRRRDLKAACAALMLVQPEARLRDVGQGMLLFHDGGSARMLTPKGILRIAELLETPEIAALNRGAGFGPPGGVRPPLGRWKRAAAHWLRASEAPGRLELLVQRGWRESVKAIARRCGHRALDPRFYEVLRWKQKRPPAPAPAGTPPEPAPFPLKLPPLERTVVAQWRRAFPESVPGPGDFYPWVMSTPLLGADGQIV
jgi:hypothetical protein